MKIIASLQNSLGLLLVEIATSLRPFVLAAAALATLITAPVVSEAQNFYVANYSDGTVQEYSGTPTAFAAGLTINAGPGPLALLLSGNTLYVTHELGSTAVNAYDVSKGGVSIASFNPPSSLSNPWGLAMSGNTLYVSHLSSNVVLAYDATTGAPITSYQSPAGLNAPNGLSISGNTLYVANFYGTVGAYDLTTGAPIAGFTPIASASTSTGPSFPLVVGNHLYVSYSPFGGFQDASYPGTVSEYDAATGAPIAGFTTITGPQYATGLAVSGNTLYVSDTGAGIVQTYDATTGALVGTYPLPPGPNGQDTPYGLVIAANPPPPFTGTFVPGTADVWLAANGATDNVNTDPTVMDSLPEAAPVRVSGVTLTAGTQLTFAVTGSVDDNPVTPTDPPDGGHLGVATHVAENGLSALTAPFDSLVGVFIDDSSPDPTNANAPAPLDFSDSSGVPGTIAFSSLQPRLNQVFFIGDGLDASGNAQKFTVPPGALHLVLGNQDTYHFSNNTGAFYVMVTSTAPPAGGSLIVPGTGNLWLAPTGATDPNGDSIPAESPAFLTGMTLVPGATLSFSVSGSVNYAGGTPTDPPDGESDYPLYHGAENGVSGVSAYVDCLLGVFLNDSPADPTNANVPPSLDFTDPLRGVTFGANYVHLDPGIGQVFFIGDGKTSGGTVQTVTVPAGATRLAFGGLDGSGWYNNSGAFYVTVTSSGGSTAPPAGGSLIVPGTANPYLAGRPNGTVASANADRAPAQSPVLVPNLMLDPDHGIVFSVGGAVANRATTAVGASPDGGAFVAHPEENGLSPITAPVNSLVGVFLGPDEPTFGGAPGILDYSNPTLFGTGASAYAPRLFQVFFVGDGLDAKGNPQAFYPPKGATRLYLGTMDNTASNDNTGSFNVGVSVSPIAASDLKVSETVLSSSQPTGNGTFALEGDVLTYIFTVKNTSAVADTNVVLTDVLPGYVDLTKVDISAGGTLTSGILTQPLGTIAAGATVTRTIKLTLLSAPLGHQFTNADYYVAADGIANVPGSDAPATLVEDAASVKVTTNAPSQRPGDSVSFTYDIANTTPTKFKKLTLTVPVPQGLIFSDVADNAYFVDSQGHRVTSTTNTVSYNPGGLVTFTINALTDDAHVFALVQFQVPYDFNPAGSVSASGARIVISKYTDGNPVTFAVDSALTPLSGQGPETEPSLLFGKSVPTGTQATAILAFSPNLGTALTATALQSYLAANPNQKFVAGLGNFTDFSALTPAQQTQVLNPFLGIDSDPEPGLSVSTVPTPLKPSTQTPVPPVPFVTFALGFVNYGAGKATSVVVNDSIPPGLAFVPGSMLLNGVPVDPSALTFSDDGKSFNVVAKNLKTGKGGVILYRATVLAPDSGGLAAGNFIQPTSAHMTVASVTSEFYAPPPGELLVTGPAHASVESSQSGRTAIGDNVTYTLFYQNDGGQTITDFQVVSLVPAGGAFVSATLLDIDQQPRQPNTAKGELLPDTSNAGTGGRVVFHLGKVKTHGLGLVQVVYQMTPAILKLPEQALIHQAYVAATGGLPPASASVANPSRVLRRLPETNGADDPTSQVASPAPNNKTLPTNSPNGPSLAMSVSHPQTVVTGEVISYTITAISLGNTSNGTVIGNPFLANDPYITLSFDFPANTEFVGADIPGLHGNFIFGDLPPLNNGGASAATVRLRATGAVGSTITIPDLSITDGLSFVTLHSGPLVVTVTGAQNVQPASLQQAFQNTLSATSKTVISGPDFAEKVSRITTNSKFTEVVGADCVSLANDVVIIPTIGNNYVVQGNASNIVAQGAGNIVAQGAGNIVAQGAGNFANVANLFGTNNAQLVGPGGVGIADIIASIVAQGAGNIVAQGAGNIVAQGAGNLQSVGFPAVIPQGFAATALEKTVVTGLGNLQTITSLGTAVQSDTFTSNNGSLTTLTSGHIIGGAGAALQLRGVQLNTADVTTAQSINPSGSILRLGNGLISQDGGGLIGEDGSSLIGEDGSSLIGEDGSSAYHGTAKPK